MRRPQTGQSSGVSEEPAVYSYFLPQGIADDTEDVFGSHHEREEVKLPRTQVNSILVAQRQEHPSNGDLMPVGFGAFDRSPRDTLSFAPKSTRPEDLLLSSLASYHYPAFSPRSVQPNRGTNGSSSAAAVSVGRSLPRGRNSTQLLQNILANGHSPQHAPPNPFGASRNGAGPAVKTGAAPPHQPFLGMHHQQPQRGMGMFGNPPPTKDPRFFRPQELSPSQSRAIGRNNGMGTPREAEAANSKPTPREQRGGRTHGKKGKHVMKRSDSSSGESRSSSNHASPPTRREPQPNANRGPRRRRESKGKQKGGEGLRNENGRRRRNRTPVAVEEMQSSPNLVASVTPPQLTPKGPVRKNTQLEGGKGTERTEVGKASKGGAAGKTVESGKLPEKAKIAVELVQLPPADKQPKRTEQAKGKASEAKPKGAQNNPESRARTTGSPKSKAVDAKPKPVGSPKGKATEALKSGVDKKVDPSKSKAVEVAPVKADKERPAKNEVKKTPKSQRKNALEVKTEAELEKTPRRAPPTKPSQKPPIGKTNEQAQPARAKPSPPSEPKPEVAKAVDPKKEAKVVDEPKPEVSKPRRRRTRNKLLRSQSRKETAGGTTTIVEESAPAPPISRQPTGLWTSVCHLRNQVNEAVQHGVDAVTTTTSAFVKWCIASIWLALCAVGRVHKKAVLVLTRDHHVTFCFSFLYMFPSLVLYLTGWAPPWAVPCIFYAFLMQVFCTQGPVLLVGIFRVVLPLLFLTEGVAHHSFLLELNGSERLVVAFLFSSFKTQDYYRPLFLFALSAQIFVALAVGRVFFVQWCVLVLSLLSLGAPRRSPAPSALPTPPLLHEPTRHSFAASLLHAVADWLSTGSNGGSGKPWVGRSTAHSSLRRRGRKRHA